MASSLDEQAGPVVPSHEVDQGAIADTRMAFSGEIAVSVDLMVI